MHGQENIKKKEKRNLLAFIILDSKYKNFQLSDLDNLKTGGMLM